MNNQPPKLPLRFLRWFCDPQLLKYIEGDLLELYQERVEKKGKRRANGLFVWDVVKLFRPGLLRTDLSVTKFLPLMMISHYIKITRRSFFRDQAFSWINLLGLTVGMTVSLLLFQYVWTERSYDSFHTDVANKYRVIETAYRNDAFNYATTQTPHRLGSEALEKLPGIRDVVRIRPLLTDEGVVVSTNQGSKKFMEYGIWYVDPGFLQMFDFPLIQGDSRTALTEQNSIVITRETALRFFGNDNPVGQTMRVHGGSISGEFIITGVLADLPTNTHMHFNFLIPMEFLLTHYGIYTRSDGWSWTNFHTYLWLEEPTDRAYIASELKASLYEHWGDAMTESGESLDISLQPLEAIHLSTDFANDLDYKNNSEANVWFLFAIAIVILLIAWINYINLASAQAMKRTKEVGVRKTIGARKNQLIGQFLFESLCFNVTALTLALLLGSLLMPYMSQLVGSQLQLSIIYSLDFWAIALITILLGTILAGSYPSLLAARFSPIGMLRSSYQPSMHSGNVFRKSLITVQLTISLLLASGTYLVYQQIMYLKSKELGIAMDQILVLDGPRVVLEEGREMLPMKHQTFRNQLLENPNIHAVSGTTNVPGTGEIWWGGMRKSGTPVDQATDGKAILVDRFFTEAYDFEFIAGGPFTADMQDYEAVIINEEAVKAFEFVSAGEAIGQSIIMTGLDTLKVHGVVKNVNWNSLRDPIAPTIFGIVDMFNAYLSIRISTQNLPETLAYIESTFRETYPTDPYHSYFLDDAFNQQYQTEQQFGSLFGHFTLIAISISIFGLFALVAYSLTLRVKEIGIRKVLGASIQQLMLLLSKEYLWMMIIAIGVEIPLFIMGARAWLDGFAYRIALDWQLFLYPLITLAIVAFGSISFRIFKAANSNPVNQLRDE